MAGINLWGMDMICCYCCGYKEMKSCDEMITNFVDTWAYAMRSNCNYNTFW